MTPGVASASFVVDSAGSSFGAELTAVAAVEPPVVVAGLVETKVVQLAPRLDDVGFAVGGAVAAQRVAKEHVVVVWLVLNFVESGLLAVVPQCDGNY